MEVLPVIYPSLPVSSSIPAPSPKARKQSKSKTSKTSKPYSSKIELPSNSGMPSMESRRDEDSPYHGFCLRRKMAEVSIGGPSNAVDLIDSSRTLEVLPKIYLRMLVSLSVPLPSSRAGKWSKFKSGKTSRPSIQPSSIRPCLVCQVDSQ